MARPEAWRRAALVGVVVAVVAAWLSFGGDPRPAIEWAERHGRWGMAAFVITYAVAVVALVPGSLLTLAAGALYGLTAGVPLVFAGAVLGACGAFLVSRYLARDWVERKLVRFPRFAAIDAAVATSGFTLVFLLRLSPVVPFTLLNYALGATRVRFRDYALASVGMLPATVLYVYSGSLAREVAAAAGASDTAPDGLRWVVLSVGLAATAAATVLITRAARRALEMKLPDARTPTARAR